MPAVRLDKDEWVTELGGDVWDDEFRVRIERQLWVLTRALLARGQSVILDWGTGRGLNGTRSGSGPVRWGRRWNSITSRCRGTN